MTSVPSLIAPKVSTLQDLYLKRDPLGVRTLAALRQSLGRDPGTDPRIWDLTMEEVESRYEPRGSASVEEWAVHIALTSYALHQQSQTAPMHVPGESFGKALLSLCQMKEREREGASKGVRRRLNALVTASSSKEFQHHLGALIRMLRSERIGFDYAAFAGQIVWFLNPRTRKSAQLQWARDFSRLSSTRLSTPTSETKA